MSPGSFETFRFVAVVLVVFTALVVFTTAIGGQTAIGTIELSAADPVASNPYSIAIDESGGSLRGYVALAGQVAPFGEPPEGYSGHHVAEFDLQTLEVTRTFAVGYYPTELLLLEDTQELYVTCSTGSSLFRIDLFSGEVMSIDLTDSVGNPIEFLSGLCLSKAGDRIFVASNGGDFDGSDENLVAVDRVSYTIVDRHVLAGGIVRMAVRPDGTLVIPVGFPGNDYTAAPEVWILPVGGTPAFLVGLPVDTSDFPAPADISVNSSGEEALISVFGGSPEIFRVDLETGTLLESIEISGGEYVQTSIALSPTQDRLAVCQFFGNTVRIIDLATGTEISSSEVGALPNSISWAGGRLWVTLQGNERVLVLADSWSFLRGDTTADGIVDIADAVWALGYLFAGQEIACIESADIDDSDTVDLSDPILLLGFLFTAGPPPAYPWPLPGGDLIADELDCDQ